MHSHYLSLKKKGKGAPVKQEKTEWVLKDWHQ